MAQSGPTLDEKNGVGGISDDGKSGGGFFDLLFGKKGKRRHPGQKIFGLSGLNNAGQRVIEYVVAEIFDKIIEKCLVAGATFLEKSGGD